MLCEFSESGDVVGVIGLAVCGTVVEVFSRFRCWIYLWEKEGESCEMGDKEGGLAFQDWTIVLRSKGILGEMI